MHAGESEICVIADNNTESNNENMVLGAQECKELDIVDIIVPEPIGGLHLNPDECFSLLRRCVLSFSLSFIIFMNPLLKLIFIYHNNGNKLL